MAIATPSRTRGAPSPDADRGARMRKLIKTLRRPGEEDEDLAASDIHSDEGGTGGAETGDDSPERPGQTTGGYLKPRSRLSRTDPNANEGGMTDPSADLSVETAVPMGAVARKPRFMASALEMPPAKPGEEKLISGEPEDTAPPAQKKAMKRRGRRAPESDAADVPVHVIGSY